MKYYIIVGEASGDVHAANLIKEIKLLDTHSHFRVWGGDKMKEQGADLVKHYRQLAFMGFYEVIANLRTIIRNLKFCKQDIIDYQPDVLILVDYPGFNLRIAEFAHNKGLKVFYYISPQIWAWKQSRVKKIRKFVDRMFVILPFEKDFYASHNVDVDYVGHPLLDVIENEKPKLPQADEFRISNGLNEKPIIALLPGSRKQEISKMLPEMLSVVPFFHDYQFVIAGASAIETNFYKLFTQTTSSKVIYHQTHALLQNAAAALVTSGTATLETALMNVPEVVCYKGNWLSFQIAKRIVHVKYISLVNLIADKQVVTELIQNDLNTINLKEELGEILEPENRQRILRDYDHLRQMLGNKGASAIAAKLMVSRLSNKMQ